MTHVVGSKEIRPRFSDCLAWVKAGDEVVVLVYGQPAGLLRAVRADDMGARVPSTLVRDRLSDVMRRARKRSLLVTWYGRAFAVLQAPPKGFEFREDIS
jgi:hypothetical protein